jgi:membrane protease YdiL (CAAX protease family)
VILSIFNAFSEEIFFRLVLFGLLHKITNNTVISNLIQSMLYSLPHFFIGGFRFAVYAFIYGVLLGIVKEKNNSVIPCVICHFSIDIGNVALPLLIILPPIII